MPRSSAVSEANAACHALRHTRHGVLDNTLFATLSSKMCLRCERLS